MRIGVSVFTYAGQAAFGVTADFASVPEADDFAATLVDEVAQLDTAARPQPAPPAKRRAAAVKRVAQLS